MKCYTCYKPAKSKPDYKYHVLDGYVVCAECHAHPDLVNEVIKAKQKLEEAKGGSHV